MLAPLENLHAARLAAQDEGLKALRSECDALYVEQLEFGQAIIELRQQLVAGRKAEQQLMAAIQPVWQLDKTPCAAHCECEQRTHCLNHSAFAHDHPVEDLLEHPIRCAPWSTASWRKHSMRSRKPSSGRRAARFSHSSWP